MTAPLQINARAMAFREWFGLQPVQARIVAFLYGSAPGYLTAAQLAVLASTSRGVVRWALPAIRQALVDEALESEPGQGYRLTDLGQAECRAALWQLGEELRGAA